MNKFVVWPLDNIGTYDEFLSLPEVVVEELENPNVCVTNKDSGKVVIVGCWVLEFICCY